MISELREIAQSEYYVMEQDLSTCCDTFLSRIKIRRGGGRIYGDKFYDTAAIWYLSKTQIKIYWGFFIEMVRCNGNSDYLAIRDYL